MDYITDSDFDNTVRSGVVVVDFNANWCAPCRAIKPKLEALSHEYNKVKFVQIDIDQHDAQAVKYHIRSIPAIQVWVDGELKETFNGTGSLLSLTSLLSSLI